MRDKRAILSRLNAIEAFIRYYENMKINYRRDIEKYDSFFAFFNDSIILIGQKKLPFKIYPNSYGQETCAKVSVHGNVIKTLSSQIFIREFLIRGKHLL